MITYLGHFSMFGTRLGRESRVVASGSILDNRRDLGGLDLHRIEHLDFCKSHNVLDFSGYGGWDTSSVPITSLK